MTKKIFSAESLFDFSFISELEFSPDGKEYLYVRNSLNRKDNAYVKEIFLGRKNRTPLKIAGGNSFSPSHSPDGKYIVFSSLREKEFRGSELYLIERDGGEAMLLCKLEKEFIRIKQWDKHSKGLFLLTSKQIVEKDKKDDAVEINEVPFWTNGGTFTNDTEFFFYYISLNGKKSEIPLKKILSEGLNKQSNKKIRINEFSLSPDNEMIAFTVCEEPEKFPYKSSIFIYNTKEKSATKLSIKGTSAFNLCWKDDSSKIAYLGENEELGLDGNSKLYIYDFAKMKEECISKKFDKTLTICSAVNSDVFSSKNMKMRWKNDKIYFTILDKDSNAIYSIDEKKNLKIESIEHGSYSAYDVNNNGEIIYSYDNFTVPQEVYILKNQKITRLTSINKKITNEYRILSYQKNTVKTDSSEIDSWIVMPSSHEEKIPAILEIHGGPKTAYGNSFMLEFQILAAQGYGVIFSNPRGSDGYGEEFCDIRKKYGTIDYEDLMAVMDFYEKNYDIDSKRTGVTGGSYGGFMTNYIVTKTDRFKAAVTQRSISNWFSMYGTSDIGYFFTRDQIGFEPWENKEEYIEKSPLFQVKNVKTPLLLIHSFEDYRCWVVEAMQFFTSLRVLGVKSKLVIFKGENHELSRSGKPFNRVKRYNEILKWFRENL